MGLFDFLRRLLFGSKSAAPAQQTARRKPRKKPRLVPFRYDALPTDRAPLIETEKQKYPFARFSVNSGGYLDLAVDGDDSLLAELEQPQLHTPSELADWLQMPLGKVAWLIDRFAENQRPLSVEQAHYHYRWMRKRRGGWRLIEAPKPILKSVQHRILEAIILQLPPHPTAHGFTPRRSILTNAKPHVGQRVTLKFDLENFYANVGLSRVTAIYRSMGYNREVANWLARLTTSALPPSMPFPDGDAAALVPFLRRHLAQGAPTSPALANLSAYSLDVRLSGLAKSFGARYTRYADDLTFSGPEDFLHSLRTFIPLVQQIIRAERFRVNVAKRRVIRDNQRQIVAGVVVNEKLNVARNVYDELKATLHNCRLHGPSSQNRQQHPDFAAHLRGRVAHVTQLNPQRGAKLLGIFQQIDWSR